MPSRVLSKLYTTYTAAWPWGPYRVARSDASSAPVRLDSSLIMPLGPAASPGLRQTSHTYGCPGAVKTP